MARISELHYSNAYAASSGVNEFLEVALDPSENPSDFTVSFYHDDGAVGFEVALDDPRVQVTVDPESGEVVHVLSADDFPILLTDPDGGGGTNYEAYALTDTATVPAQVIDFYDIGGGTQNIVALDGAAAGAVSENLAVLVGPNQTTTTLQFNKASPDTLTYGSVGSGDTGLACFVAGTRIDTDEGPRRIEALQPGDAVATLDDGVQPVRWIGSRLVPGTGRFAPVRIARGTLGATRDVWLSPQHRVLIAGWQAELFFGLPEVLVPAKALVNGTSVRRVPRAFVHYVHILFDRHQIVRTSGLDSESFLPCAAGHAPSGTALEVAALFPEIVARGAGPRAARPTRPVAEARALRAG